MGDTSHLKQWRKDHPDDKNPMVNARSAISAIPTMYLTKYMLLSFRMVSWNESGNVIVVSQFA